MSVAVGDFNNDTRLDIVTANCASNDVSVLLQLNRGALRKKITYASGGASDLRCIAIADMNNDTRLDIVVANYGTDNIGILFRIRKWHFRKSNARSRLAQILTRQRLPLLISMVTIILILL